jgi:hypothetical protein
MITIPISIEKYIINSWLAATLVWSDLSLTYTLLIHLLQFLEFQNSCSFSNCAQFRGPITFRNKVVFMVRNCQPLAQAQAEWPSFVGCPRLLIQYIHSYAQFVTGDASCRDDRGPNSTLPICINFFYKTISVFQFEIFMEYDKMQEVE